MSADEVRELLERARPPASLGKRAATAAATRPSPPAGSARADLRSSPVAPSSLRLYRRADPDGNPRQPTNEAPGASCGLDLPGAFKGRGSPARSAAPRRGG